MILISHKESPKKRAFVQKSGDRCGSFTLSAEQKSSKSRANAVK